MRENMKRLSGSLAAKVTAFILLVVMACVSVGSVVSAALMWDQGLYTQSQEGYKQAVFDGMTYNEGWDLLDQLIVENAPEEVARQCMDRNFTMTIFDQTGKSLWSNEEMGKKASWIITQEYHIGAVTPAGETEEIEPQDYKVHFSIYEPFVYQDRYAIANTLIDWAYALRYSIYAIGGIALLLTVICFVFLMCSAGRRNGHKELMTSFVTRMPFDLLTTVCILAGVLCIAFALEESTYWSVEGLRLASYAAVGMAVVVLTAAWCYDFAVRVKLGHWWRNTLIYKILRLVWHGAKAVGRGVAALFGNLPLIWKTALIMFGLTVAEFFGMVAFAWDMGALVFFWFLEKLVVVPAVLYFALVLRKLEKGGKALAAGDLSYQVDTRKMIWDFKGHGENLNSIADGMAAAVEERLKSERLKTELITNVSHDIKTPLTSIINYADLIGKEPTDNEKITEYADVLHRQSERLKKLIEDLVEASKASTGNLEVLLAPCEPGVLVTQTAGEYEQRLAERNLTLVTKQPETPVKILADGRRLWRVFDNLMNNVCKYAQSGTRVYLSVEEEGTDAVISLKNTSREPLNLTAEEFMERFVRGDSSRSTEGSGLGLSIARSMTELQNGKMELTVDGDLFKVVLRFQKI